MPEISVNLPDGSSKSVPEGATVLGVAEAIGPRLAQAALAGKVNGALVDVNATANDGDTVEIITEKSPEALGILRHSAAHVMAEAVKDLFPMVQFGIGPAIEDGFYYDFELSRSTFTPDDLGASRRDAPHRRRRRSPSSARRSTGARRSTMFEQQKLKSRAHRRASRGRNHLDLPPGRLHRPVPRPARAAHRAHRGLQAPERSPAPTGAATRRARCCSASTAPRGSAPRSWTTYLNRLEEAEKRDHRKLGSELDLFSFHEVAGAGLPIYHPTGAPRPASDRGWLRGISTSAATRGDHPAHRQDRRLEDQRPLRLLRARTCTSSRSMRAKARSTSTPSSR